MSVLSDTTLRSLILGEKPMIRVAKDRLDDLIQAASLDCPLGDRIYRVPFSSVPSPEQTIEDLLERSSYELDLSRETFLERNSIYIAPLDVELSLGDALYGEFSPKSTTGRNDVFVRILTNNRSRFDVTARGYSGRLYLEIIPMSYPVRVSPGLSLTQMRLKDREELVGNEGLQHLHARYGIVRDGEGKPLEHSDLKVRQDGIFLHVNLSAPVIGLEARDYPEAEVDLSRKEAYDPSKYWTPIRNSSQGSCVLSPGKFYLLQTKERVRIPPDYCAWMKPYDVASGEFRSHYAGFFDNGFGGDNGTVGVLEVRVRDAAFEIKDGQPICHFVFEKTDETPSQLYDGSYTESGPSLGKTFRDRYAAWTADYWSV